ncbi:MAG TPA: MFS transporter [Solirubrobacteraceae bacterium]|jgi:EmrB/QacA subfamily drug resistance transporter
MRSTDPDRSRWLALYVLCLGMLMIVLDVTVVNVALPSIQTDLRFSQAGLAWVVNAYLIAFGGLLLLAGRVGDLVGHKRIFLAGLGIFTLASFACGLAQSQATLVVARFVQGAGGAMTSAVILGMIVRMFPAPREQAKAIGVYGFVASAGGSVGLLAGGVLTQAINWHWIFFVNVPIGIATAFAAVRLLEDSPGLGLQGGADLPGALLIVAALMLGVYTIVAPAAQHGWGSTPALGFGAGSLALFALFLAREATARTPLVPLRILRSRDVAGANAIQALLVAGMFGMFFLGALYLQRVLGYDALQIGLAFLPTTIVMGTLSLRYSERLIMRFGARRTLLPGMVLVAAGLLLFARLPVHGSYLLDILPVMLLLGAGVGSSFPALMTLAMSGADPQDAGLASGLVNTTAQVGGALGLAVLATVSATRSGELLHAGRPLAAALTGGYHLAFLIGAGLVGLAVLVALNMSTPQRGGQAEAVADGAGARAGEDHGVEMYAGSEAG